MAKIPKPSLKVPSFLPANFLKISPLLFWRIALAALVVLCLILVGVIWMSGTRETRDAFNDGRRLLIRLDNGDIQGEMASTESTPTPAPTPSPAAADKPAASTASGQPVPAATPAVSADTVETPAPTDTVIAARPEEMVQLPTPLATPDNSPIIPAAVPMATINPSLTEKTDAGLLPILGSDGTKPWRYYSKSYDRKGSLPMIAIIVTGLGESKTVTESAMKLPENFGLSFSPYAKDADNWIKTARIAGHEVFFDLPLQPTNYPASDPGPYGLLVGKGQDENTRHLQWLMSRTAGYVGFVTPQNEVFSSNTDAFKGLLQTLSERGLLLVVGHEPAKTETKQMLDAGTSATITADTLIDEDLSATAIEARLTALEQIAKTRGYAVGIASAFPVTIQQLNAWAAKLPSQGFVLVPVTFIVHLRFS